MKTVTKLLLVLLLLSTTIVTGSTIAQSAAVTDAQTETNKAYTAIIDAYNAGADTTQLTEQLNQAIRLTVQAQKLANSNPQEAETLANQAKEIAQNVTQQATLAQQQASNALPIIPIAAAATLIAVGVIVYLLGPKFLWRIWFKLRKNNQIKVGNGSSDKKGAIFLTAEQLCAVVLAVLVIVAFLSVSGILLPKNSGEPFSELGVLGPNMQLGDYPSVVVATETVNLNGYVGNHMGTPMYYSVLVKLGDNNTAINPSPLTPIQQYNQVIQDNQTWTFPVKITLNNPGVNQRIIFELWIYNQTTNQNQYHERWGQIWLNVTAPAR